MTQLVIVGLVVGLAAIGVVRSMWKTWFGTSATGCGAGCGRCSAPVVEPRSTGRFPLPQV
jgi:hypothetical protein